MRKLYEALSVDVVKFEAQDVITASGTLTDKTPNDPSADKETGGTQGGEQIPDPNDSVAAR